MTQPGPQPVPLPPAGAAPLAPYPPGGMRGAVPGAVPGGVPGGVPGAVPPGGAAVPPHVAQQLDLIRRQQMADARVEELAKSPAPAYLLWFFFGVFGVHRFYLKSPGVALGQLFTLGGLGIWSFVDVFFINRRLQQLRSDLRRQVYAQYGVPIA